MEKLLKYILENITQVPESIKITPEVDEYVTRLHVRVDPTDMPKVIGKKGRTIRAIRQLVNTKALLLKQNKALVVLEE